MLRIPSLCPGTFWALLLFLPSALFSQSTQAGLLGTVRDTQGAVLPNARVVITNLDKNQTKTLETDNTGSFEAVELLPGVYQVEASSVGFSARKTAALHLGARQQMRLELILTIASTQQQITVDANAASGIETDTAAIASTLNAESVMSLPANYRGSGGTSPLNLIQVLPGVQSDTASGTSSLTASGSPASNFSVQGGQPFQTEISVDGISTQNVTSNKPLSDAFPSSESISEIRVEGVSNNAEFGQAGEVTTITKSGTNHLHGAGFWYVQNSALDATSWGNTSKTQKSGNDFGVSLLGPVVLPHLYHGRDKTFFMATYEGFYLPKQTAIHDLVPTGLMRQGDFSAEYPAGELVNPADGSSYGSSNQITSINASAKPFLSFFPSPNYGDFANISAAENSAGGYNYSDNRDSDYNSNQFDLRLDHHWNDKLQGFARYTFKNVNLIEPQDLNIASVSDFDKYRILTSALIYAINPHLMNEFRFGFTSEHNGKNNTLDGSSYTKAAGFNDINSSYKVDGISYVYFPTGLTTLEAGNYDSTSQSHLFQYNDNLTWIHGYHVVKFGTDIRDMDSITTLGNYGSTNVEAFVFAGVYTSGFDTLPTNSSSTTAYQFADYLTGVPYETEYYTLVPKNEGKTTYYGFFAQDQWRVSDSLTLSYGLRYEYHPAYHDATGQIGNFDPSVSTTGTVIYPDGYKSSLDSTFLTNFDACGYGPSSTDYADCTPVESNSEAHLPNSLRKSQKDRLLPRFGLAWRPFHDDKTAIRAGFGLYNTTMLGKIFFSMTDTLQAASLTYQNSIDGTYPETYSWPETAPGDGSTTPVYGSASFGTANQIDWKDPYSMQWSLSTDHEFNGGLSLRVSYIGMKTDHLVRGANQNDMSYSSTTKATSRPLTDRPFPNWGTVNDRVTDAQANFHSLQLEANRHFSNGVSFQSTYTWSKNLADNQGTRATAFASENGSNVNGDSTYGKDRKLDYGNVYGTRQHRWITTSVYALPFGRGRRFAANAHGAEDLALGGWQLSNIVLWQTGPYLTSYIPSGAADPSGTGSSSVYGRDQRPDLIGSSVPHNRTRSQWLNKEAFACPSNGGYSSSSYAGNSCTVGVNSAPIGRFGSERVGSIVGPGTVNWSSGLNKHIDLPENMRMTMEATFTNILNHTNLNDPNLDVTSASFGKITSSRGSDFGGNRTGQLSVRLEF